MASVCFVRSETGHLYGVTNDNGRAVYTHRTCSVSGILCSMRLRSLSKSVTHRNSVCCAMCNIVSYPPCLLVAFSFFFHFFFIRCRSLLLCLFYTYTRVSSSHTSSCTSFVCLFEKKPVSETV